MPDDKNIIKPLDSQRVNVTQDYEIAYWTKELGCSEVELKKAVDKVGTYVDDVKKQLGK